MTDEERESIYRKGFEDGQNHCFDKEAGTGKQLSDEEAILVGINNLK